MGEHKLKSHGWTQIHMPMPDMVRSIEEADALVGLFSTRTKSFIKGACRVLISEELRKGDDTRRWLHLSISCADRYPTWEEMKDARYSLLPMGLTFAQILPPLNEFVNVHPNCFHLWELESNW